VDPLGNGEAVQRAAVEDAENQEVEGAGKKLGLGVGHNLDNLGNEPVLPRLSRLIRVKKEARKPEIRQGQD
jgi:hypothetical protein